ncbi:MAG: dihydropteroate synthase [Nitrospirae bacterium]|nr:dihydropteroate synthase [Nitrospirota bacterium]
MNAFKIRCGRHLLNLNKRPYIMGILNVTPDSFSNGGHYLNINSAIEHARRMAAEGADIIDIGGESSRPGSEPVPLEVEAERVLPIIKALSKKINLPISIDTYKAKVAREALKTGASIINDISGLRFDPLMAKERIAFAVKNGIKRNKIIIDPGIGFGKTVRHNLEIIKRLSEFKKLGVPILIGTSRKSFIGKILNATVDKRLEGTAAAVAISIANGANIVRVHDVKTMADVARITDAIITAS